MQSAGLGWGATERALCRAWVGGCFRWAPHPSCPLFGGGKGTPKEGCFVFRANRSYIVTDEHSAIS